MFTKMQSMVLVGALVVSMAISSFAGDNTDTQNKDTIHLERLGVSFTKPDDWFNQNAEEFQKTRERINSRQESDLLSLLATQGDIPIATYCKFDPTSHRGIIPTITVLVRPNNSSDFRGFLEMSKLSAEAFKNYFNNMAFIVEPVEVEISGKKSVMFEFEYDLILADNSQFRVRSIVHAIPFKDAFVQVGMTELSSKNKSEQFGYFMEALEISSNRDGIEP